MAGVLPGLANAGFFEVGSMIPGMAIFYGGIAQFVAGLDFCNQGCFPGLYIRKENRGPLYSPVAYEAGMTGIVQGLN